MFHGGSGLRNFSKKIKKFSKFQPKTHKTVPKRIQKCFEHVLGQIFRKIFAQFSMEGRVFENFQKKTKNFQNSNQKRTKPFPKESKSVLNMFWGKFFEKFLPSFPWKVESSKIFKKNQKKFKIPKRPKIVPKSIQTSSERVLGQIFRKIFAQFSMECRVFETFQKKIKKFSKFQPKTHKTVPKRIQKCFEHVLGQFFRKSFAQFSMGGRVFENFQKKKTKNFQSSKKAENRYQKCPNVF